MNKKFVFITGPSESGKSGAAEYMERNFRNVKHLKMRDIIKIADSKVDDSTEQFWNEYINTALSMSEEKSIIIMDTLRKPESALILGKLLGNKMTILYIEASLKNRIIREYNKLNREGKNLIIEDVAKRTKEKDMEKEKFGLKKLKNLRILKDGILSTREDGEIFPYIINNDGDIEQLHEKLNQFIYELERT